MRSHVGEAPPATASEPNVTVAVALSMWFGASTVAGTTWHSAQAMADERLDDPRRWAWCAPTDVRLVRAPPVVSTGGAWSGGLLAIPPALPWQLLHACPLTSTMPLTCFVLSLNDPAPPFTQSRLHVAVWQNPHSVEAGWPFAVGGAPWHVPHAACVPLTTFHVGVVSRGGATPRPVCA